MNAIEQDHPQVPGQLPLSEDVVLLGQRTIVAGLDDVARRHTEGHRDGDTYAPALDYDRLNKQSRRIYDVMRDGMWRTLRQIEDQTGDPQASISARLRDFRKQRYGGLLVERRRVEGTWFYRLVVTEP